MTREEAKSILLNAAWLGTNEGREKIESAVEFLCGEPCDDAISRQAVLESIFDDDTEYTGSEICSMVRNLPSVNSQEPTIEAYKQVCKERDIAIEQLHELGYEWGQKIEQCEGAPHISKDKALQAMCSHCDLWQTCKMDCLRRKAIEALPSVKSQEKTGHWIYGEDTPGTGRDGWFCNQCGHFEFWDYSLDMKSAKLNLPNPCPNCGAKMESEEQE